MNYRHAFHVGNPGDVLKHLVLLAALERLRAKARPLMVLDTHAGAGLYNLAGPEAARSPEWQGGIGALWPLRRPGNRRTSAADAPASPLPAPLPAALAALLEAVAAWNPDGHLSWYPGSPLLAAAGQPAGERLVLVERHPATAQDLRATLACLPPMVGSPRVTVVEGDGYERLVGLMPPPERRALVLVDPPYEATDDWAQAVGAITRALRRLPQAVIVLWMPIKDAAEDARRLVDAAAGLPPAPRLDVTLMRGPAAPVAAGLRGSRVLMLNPPWPLPQLLPPALERVAAGLPGGPWQAAATLLAASPLR